MATYLISDIHGNLETFKKLLNIIHFDYEKDILYLLGDYVDWGPLSIKTLQYVMELSSKYENIHPLIGNHELFFIDQIKAINKDPVKLNDTWLYYNGGEKTLEEYLMLERFEQKEIENFLDRLPFVTETVVNEKKYLLAHENIYKNLRYKAVWERILRKVPNVIKWFDKGNKYETFICGHTITSTFNIDKRLNSGYIDIDCGAKILGHKEFEEEPLSRLGALRLDDMKEFYAR